MNILDRMRYNKSTNSITIRAKDDRVVELELLNGFPIGLKLKCKEEKIFNGLFQLHVIGISRNMKRVQYEFRWERGNPMTLGLMKQTSNGTVIETNGILVRKIRPNKKLTGDLNECTKQI